MHSLSWTHEKWAVPPGCSAWELSQQPLVGIISVCGISPGTQPLSLGWESKAPYASPAMQVNHFQLASREQLDEWWKPDAGNLKGPKLAVPSPWGNGGLGCFGVTQKMLSIVQICLTSDADLDVETSPPNRQMYWSIPFRAMGKIFILKLLIWWRILLQLSSGKR